MSVTRYRKRPVEVDTVQWTGSNLDELVAFTGGRFRTVDPEEGTYAPGITALVYDELHDTWVGLYTGQHIVRGVKGEYYPIAEDVLAETYESAVPAPATDQAVPSRRAVCPDREPLLGVQCVKEAGHEVHSDRPGRIWYPAPADQAALRDRIAALFRQSPGGERLGDATPGEIADAVLAVLPAIAELRRMADETQQPETVPWGVCPDCRATAGPDCDCPPAAPAAVQQPKEAEL